MSSSDSSSSTDSLNASKQVQFGVTHISTGSLTDEDFNFQLAGTEKSIDSEISDNVNERLRHQAPQLEEEYQLKSLSRRMAAVSTVLLQICYQKITFFRVINKMSKIEIGLEYVPLDEKYNNAEHEILMILHPSGEYHNFRKLQKDLSWLETVLRALIINLQRSFYFEDFTKILDDDNSTRQEENMLLSAKMFNQHELRKLKTYLNEEKRKLTTIVQEVTEQLGNAKDQLNDDIIETAVKLNYISEWEKSRHEQNTITLKRKEQNLIDITNNMTSQIDKENRVHEELLIYLSDSLEDYKEEINHWMEQYDIDIEDKEEKLASLKIKLEQQKDDYERLFQEYTSRQQMMDEYKEHKIQMQKEAEELERRTKAAIIIQSWWRGVMFRKHLGPYRKRRRGKKGSGRHSGKKSKSGSAKKSAKRK